MTVKMKLRNQIIKALKDMPPEDILKVYELVMLMKSRRIPLPVQRTDLFDYDKIREILAKCHGSLVDDIRRDREDRF